jgi:hypothetical protein
MSAKLKAVALGVVLLLVFSLVGVSLSYKQVPECHVGVQKDWGAVNGNTLDSGANWISCSAERADVETRARLHDE